MYKLRARFSERAEAPQHPLIAHAKKMEVTKKDREIVFSKKPMPCRLKEEIKKHFEKHNGKIELFGDILYYEFYDNGTVSYFDTEGNPLESPKFLDEEYKKTFFECLEVVKKAINEVDPFDIAWVDENEYMPEIKDLTFKLAGKSLNKKTIFNKTKQVFDRWFSEKEENIPKYWEIAEIIYKNCKRKNNERNS